MDVNLRKCNGCEKLNKDSELGWVRVSGIEASDSKKPMPVHNIKLDFCPACATSTTIAGLPEIVSVIFKASLPEHMRKQLEAAVNPIAGIPTGPAIRAALSK